MLDISTFKSPNGARVAARRQFEAERPKPQEPTRPDLQRPRLVSVGQTGRVWLEVVGEQSYYGHSKPEIRLCQAEAKATAGLDIEELGALQAELDRAAEDYSRLVAFHEEYEAWKKADKGWEEAQREAGEAGANAWHTANPGKSGRDADREDEDEDDDER